jgi:hypothetical protein
MSYFFFTSPVRGLLRLDSRDQCLETTEMATTIICFLLLLFSFRSLVQKQPVYCALLFFFVHMFILLNKEQRHNALDR